MKKILIAALLTINTFAAFADTSNFHFVQMSYSQVGLDEVEKDLDGFEFKMNYKIRDNLYLNWENIEVNNSEADLKMRNLGLGFHTGLRPGLEGFAQLDWTRLKADDATVNPNTNEDGYRFSLGIRNQRLKNLEINAVYEYLDIDKETSNVFVLGAVYSFSDRFSILATHKKQDNSDFDQFGIGLRYAIK